MASDEKLELIEAICVACGKKMVETKHHTGVDRNVYFITFECQNPRCPLTGRPGKVPVTVKVRLERE